MFRWAKTHTSSLFACQSFSHLRIPLVSPDQELLMTARTPQLTDHSISWPCLPGRGGVRESTASPPVKQTQRKGRAKKKSLEKRVYAWDTVLLFQHPLSGFVMNVSGLLIFKWIPAIPN